MNPHIISSSPTVLGPSDRDARERFCAGSNGTTIYDALLPGFNQGTIVCPNLISISHLGPKELPALDPVCVHCNEKESKGMTCCRRCSKSINQNCMDASVVFAGAWMCKECSEAKALANNLWLLPGSTKLSDLAELLQRWVLKTWKNCRSLMICLTCSATCGSICNCSIFNVYF